MELQLNRNDLLQTTTTAPGTLVVLPIGENKNQKIAVGDFSGTLQCFSIKKGEVAYAYKGLPGPQKITSVSLGRHRTQKDKIFYAAGNSIKGITKKGKEFFRFSTNLTEAIRGLGVSEKNIWCAGEYVHNHFVDGKDTDFFLCNDRINASEVVPVTFPTDLNPILACQDRCVRVLNGGEVLYSANTASPATACKHVLESHDPHHRHPDAKEVLYGMEDGTVRQLMLEPDVMMAGFNLENRLKLGAITALFSDIDFTKNGINDIAVGRDDGSIELYDIDEAGRLQQVWSTKLTESVHTMAGGFITSAAAQDLVVQTFSGKVISYSTMEAGLVIPLESSAAKKSAKRGAMSLEDLELQRTYELRIQGLRKEVEELTVKVEDQRAKYSSVAENLAAAVSMFSVADKCRLLPEECCYLLGVECAVPIFTLAVQSTLDLHLMDVSSNVAILNRSPPDERNGNLTLATYRCQESTNKLQIKFRAQEGNPGMIHVYVVPHIAPKTCQLISHRIKPLCLHQAASRDVETNAGPLSELTLTGTFKLQEIHSWIMMCLPEVPPHIPAGEDKIELHYQHVLLACILICRYRNGEAKFWSESVSTLSLLRETIMREATQEKQRVNVNIICHPSSLEYGLNVAWPKLEQHRSIQRRKKMLEALQELKMQDGDMDYLDLHQQAMMADSGLELTDAAEQAYHLRHMHNIIKQLYIDYCQLSNVAAPKSRLQGLEELLGRSTSTQQEVLHFMQGKTAVY